MVYFAVDWPVQKHDRKIWILDVKQYIYLSAFGGNLNIDKLHVFDRLLQLTAEHKAPLQYGF